MKDLEPTTSEAIDTAVDDTTTDLSAAEDVTTTAEDVAEQVDQDAIDAAYFQHRDKAAGGNAGKGDTDVTPAETEAEEHLEPTEEAADDTAAADATVQPLSDTEKALSRQLFKRLHVAADPAKIEQTLEIMGKLPPAQREAFLNHLQDTQDEFDRRFKALNGGKAPEAADPGDIATPSPTTAQPGQLPPELQEAWKAAVEYWTPEGAGPLQGAVMATAQAMAQQMIQNDPVREQYADYLEHQLESSLQAAIDGLELPEGVNKDDPTVQQKLRDAIVKDVAGRFNWKTNNFGHAAPRAAASLFNQQQQAAARKATNQARAAALRSSPSPVTRPPLKPAALTQDQKDELAFKAIKSGKKGDDVRAVVASAGG